MFFFFCRFVSASDPAIVVPTSFAIGHIIRQAYEGNWITYSEASPAGQADEWFSLFGVYYLFVARNVFLLFVTIILAILCNEQTNLFFNFAEDVHVGSVLRY